MQSGDFKSAFEVGLQLNSIEPSDTEVLLCIVLAAKKGQIELPTWVMTESWPNATDRDKLMRMAAEELIK